ncbi:putative px domain-containing protein [Neofusicoccum parvum]|uniref:Px domain-containing protein n=1 Tax=Neofusicoccum parvum TaxID=310453 RepID=A0ACB5SGS7_9PEZI|nr:putative px domain-containing protein [Neofusicoccum parvum]
MFSTYRGGNRSSRGRGNFGRGGSSSSSSSRQRGRFEHGTWYCDCSNPALPAEHFKVRKEGPNKGRWFYTCQKKEDQRCGFFLWDDDAKPRMEAAVLAGRAAEPAYGAAATTAAAAAATKGNGAAKRKFLEEVDGEETQDEDDGDEEYGWAPEVGVEDAIGRVLDSNHATMPPPSTPRKALKGSLHGTPGGSGLMTPVSHRTSNGAGPASKAADAATPTPARFGTTATTPSTTGGGDDIGDTIVPEVLHLLQERGVQLDNEAGDALQKVLKAHSLRMQGLARGRDISRLAVRERNAKIAELQARITALEAELETQKAVIGNLNWQKETGQFD